MSSSTTNEESGGYKPLHPELFQYDPKFIDPTLVEATASLKEGQKLDPTKVTREPVEQIYHFQLFTEEFCRLLIEEAEHCGKWVTEEETFEQVNTQGLVEVDDPETTQHLHQIDPKLEAVYYEVVEKHIRPLVQSLWKTFTIQKMDRPYVLKYEPEVIKEMGLHHDMETVAMVVTLSQPDDYQGGGTYFPKWDYSTGKPRPGTAIVYPGGVSHEHMGLPISAGKRFLFLGSFY
ncbi:Procollagen-lysine,2-oxoglutarate 5-dioxygenase 1 [Balamuthia mandrillaris]